MGDVRGWWAAWLINQKTKREKIMHQSLSLYEQNVRDKIDITSSVAPNVTENIIHDQNRTVRNMTNITS